MRSSSAYDPRQIRNLARLVRDGRFDIVHAHEAVSDVLTYLQSFVHRVPIVSTSHGWITNSLKGWFMVGLDQRVLARFDRVMSMKMQRELICAGVSPAKVTLCTTRLSLRSIGVSRAQGRSDRLVGKVLSGPVLVSIGRLSLEDSVQLAVKGVVVVKDSSTPGGRRRHATSRLAGGPL